MRVSQTPSAVREIGNETNAEVEKIVRANNLKPLIVHILEGDNRMTPKNLIYELVKRLVDEQYRDQLNGQEESRMDKWCRIKQSIKSIRYGTYKSCETGGYSHLLILN